MLGTVERKKQREDEGQYKMDDRIGKVFFYFYLVDEWAD